MPISSPTDIAGCIVWLAADRESLSDNDPVSTASNGGSGGGNPTAAGSARPTYKTGITPSGKPVFRFDGSANVLVFGSDPIASGASSLFAVVKLLSTPSSYDPVYIAAASFTGQRMCLKTSSATWGTFAGSDENASSTLSTGTWYLLEMLNAAGAGGGNFYVSGVSDGTYATEPYGSGDVAQVGAEQGPSRFSNIDIAAIVMYDTVLSAGNRADVEAYLTSRYITSGAGSSSFQGTAFQPNSFQEGSFFNPQLVTPGTLALALTPFTPTVLNPQSATPGTLALVLTPFAPTVLAYHNQSGFQTSFQTDAFQVGWQFSFVGAVPGTLALTLTPFTPTVAATANKFVTPGTLALTLTPFVPTVAKTSNVLVTPGTLALVLTAYAPTVTGSGPPVPPSPPPTPGQSAYYSTSGGTLVGDYRRHKEQDESDEEFLLAASWRYFV
jgi:hypothetical protein